MLKTSEYEDKWRFAYGIEAVQSVLEKPLLSLRQNQDYTSPELSTGMVLMTTFPCTMKQIGAMVVRIGLTQNGDTAHIRKPIGA